MFKAIADGFNHLFGFMKSIGAWILDGILWIFKPLFDLISALFYFLYYLGLIIVKIIHLVFTVCKLLIGLIAGLFKTITGLSYTGQGSTVIPSRYTEAFMKIGNTLDALQLDKVAYIMIFALWVFTAFSAIKIIGSMRGGSE